MYCHEGPSHHRPAGKGKAKHCTAPLKLVQLLLVGAPGAGASSVLSRYFRDHGTITAAGGPLGVVPYSRTRMEPASDVPLREIVWDGSGDDRFRRMTDACVAQVYCSKQIHTRCIWNFPTFNAPKHTKTAQ